MSTQPQSVRVSTFLEKVESRTAKIVIIGLGYVGLPLALLYSEQKFAVTGFDIDQKKVDTLTQGGTYIVRIPPTEIAQAKRYGFSATADYAGIAAMDAGLGPDWLGLVVFGLGLGFAAVWAQRLDARGRKLRQRDALSVLARDDRD